jgi:hypothetical protein
MTKVLTIRVAPSELDFCDARAKELGVTRTDFVRSRRFDSPPSPGSGNKKRFASMDLIGSLVVGRGSANENVRAALGKRKTA